MFAPVYAAMTPCDTARALATPSLAALCSLAIVLMPLPSSAVAAIAAITAERFSAVTPVIPNAARSCAVSAGEAVPPAAMMLSRLTMLAKLESAA